MSKKQEQKEATRRRMLDAAGRTFREHGFDGIGVDGIAKQAEATSGAFYAHFGSKSGAFDAALDAGLDEVIERLPEFRATHGVGWVQAFADYYLGRAHRDDRACGCAMTALSPDVVRAGPETRARYEANMQRIADIISDGLAGDQVEDRQARAWAMLSALIGGLTLARAVADQKTADNIAGSAHAAALAAAGPARA
ncbi:MAG: AcrR family transcriptional regulator [Maricaulis maris]|jgi:TetR/AcrR family transcriptional repressor of nem operon